ncbi:MAG: prepilin peptidase [Actinomycetota bacterium]|nr:prepilin peptidase [Actinomycetota bacterium]
MGSTEASQVTAILASGVTGLVVGSFLNVVAYRLPRSMSVVEPPSHCPSCDAQLTVVDLVPVLSWLWLRGRCRHCGAHISWRYPVVELATGVLCAAAAASLGSVLPLPSIAVVLVCALGASITDADDATVPGAFAVVGALAAVSLVPIALIGGHADRLAWAGLGALLASLGGLVGDRAGEARRWVRIALLACLAWTAGWLWPGGGAFVAAWIVVATAATGLGTVRRAPFAMLAAGSVVAVFASALINRP